MTPNRAPSAAEAFFLAYRDEVPRWLRRFHVPKTARDDARQDVWLAALETLDAVPASAREARLCQMKLAATVAARWRYRADLAEQRWHSAEPDNLVSHAEVEARALSALVLFVDPGPGA